MPAERATTVKAAAILAAFLLTEGAWVAVNMAADPRGFREFLGFAPGRLGTVAGWLLALAVTAAFVLRSMRLPSVRANLAKPSWLKLLALGMALAAGILEEAVFRRMLMNYLERQGFGVAPQVLSSAVAFGVSHGVWGVFGRSYAAAFAATLVTGALGGALAVVYVVSDRSVAACVAAHVLIDLCIEPGLVLAALRGEMGAGPRTASRLPP